MIRLDLKELTIIILSFLLFACFIIMFEQHNAINYMRDEIESNRKFIDYELHIIDSIYDNNYRLWDWRVNELLKYEESRGYLFQK